MSHITNDINLVLKRLSNEEIAAIPTETVYGLAADAFSDSAIKKVFSTKKRPINHPLIMHIAPQWDLTQWVSYIPDYAYKLMKAFWPGPLTLILPVKSGAISPLITGGQNSIAIRAPNHEITQELLLQFGKPLVAPSANPFGKISPTTAQHVQDSFPADDFVILNGGRCAIGVESTIINALDPFSYQIARPGIITEAIIAKKTLCKSQPIAKNIRFSGGLPSHYQPEKNLYYIDNIKQAFGFFKKTNVVPYILTFSNNYPSSFLYTYQFPKTSKDSAYELYYRLRMADQSDADFILIELPPNDPIWLVIREKILKMAQANLADCRFFC